jgi:hypothetical protein
MRRSKKATTIASLLLLVVSALVVSRSFVTSRAAAAGSCVGGSQSPVTVACATSTVLLADAEAVKHIFESVLQGQMLCPPPGQPVNPCGALDYSDQQLTAAITALQGGDVSTAVAAIEQVRKDNEAVLQSNQLCPPSGSPVNPCGLLNYMDQQLMAAVTSLQQGDTAGALAAIDQIRRDNEAVLQSNHLCPPPGSPVNPCGGLDYAVQELTGLVVALQEGDVAGALGVIERVKQDNEAVLAANQVCPPSGQLANPCAELDYADAILTQLVTSKGCVDLAQLNSVSVCDQRPAVADVTHNPPLIAMPGEAVTLTYIVTCPVADLTGGDCNAQGTVHVIAPLSAKTVDIPLVPNITATTREYVASIPTSLLQAGALLQYWATVQIVGTGVTVTVPTGGATATSTLWVAPTATTVALPGTFDAARTPDSTVVSGGWGAGAGQFGLDAPTEGATVGPSSFDFAPDGSLDVLDDVNQRLVRVDATGVSTSVPLDMAPARSDLATDPQGNLAVLQEASLGSGPRILRFSPDGVVLSQQQIADRTADEIRQEAAGPFVHTLPSDQWVPVLSSTGAPLDPTSQAALGTVAPLIPTGGQLVVKAMPTELRVGLLSNGGLTRVWRLTSTLPIGEYQLAQPLGNDLVVVFRQYDDTQSQFRVLRLTSSGVSADFVATPKEYAEASPFSEFRLATNGDLYQATSTAQGFAIVKYALGGAS